MLVMWPEALSPYAAEDALSTALSTMDREPDIWNKLAILLRTVDPFAAAEHRYIDTWEQLLDRTQCLKRLAENEEPKLAGQIGVYAASLAWFPIEIHQCYEGFYSGLSLGLEASVDFVDSEIEGDDDRRLAAANRLFRVFALVGHPNCLPIAAALHNATHRLRLFGLTRVDTSMSWRCEQALNSLSRTLGKLCAELTIREPPIDLLDELDRPRSQSTPVRVAYGTHPEESAMAFFRRVYEGVPFEQRPFADTIRREDILLYRRLSYSLARNKERGVEPSAMVQLFPSRESARGGKHAWASDDATRIARNDELRRKRNRERMKAYRRKKSNKTDA